MNVAKLKPGEYEVTVDPRTDKDKKHNEVLEVVGNNDGYPRIVFELKWWNRESREVIDAIDADVQKWRRWDSSLPLTRVLLAFWHSADTAETWQNDVDGIDHFCKGRDCDLGWTARFPTHHFSRRPHYFAIRAVLVNAE